MKVATRRAAALAAGFGAAAAGLLAAIGYAARAADGAARSIGPSAAEREAATAEGERIWRALTAGKAADGERAAASRGAPAELCEDGPCTRPTSR